MGAAQEAAGVTRQRRRAEIRASHTHLPAPRPQICRRRAQGVRDRPRPRTCALQGPRKGGVPCCKAPRVTIMALTVRVCGGPGPCPDPGRPVQPAATPGPSAKRRSDAFHPSRHGGKGVSSPRSRATLRGLRARVLRDGRWGLQDPGAKVGWSRWAISLCCRCSSLSPCCAATQLRAAPAPGPHTHLHSSQRQLGGRQSRCCCGATLLPAGAAPGRAIAGRCARRRLR